MSPEITKLQPAAPASPDSTSLRPIKTVSEKLSPTTPPAKTGDSQPPNVTPPGTTPPKATSAKPGTDPAKPVKVRPKRIYPWKKIVTTAILLGGVVFVLGYGWKIWQFAQEKDLPKTTVSLPAVDEAALAAIRSRATGVAGQNFDQVPTGTRSNPFSGAPAPTTPTQP